MTGSVPIWLEKLLDIPAAGAGESTGWTLDSAWWLAPWVTLLLMVGLAALAVGLYLHESGTASRRLRAVLACLRISAFAIVLFMLAEYVLSLERKGLPYIVVAVDDSASMGVIDRQDDPAHKAFTERLSELSLSEATRLNLAKTLLLENDSRLLETLANRYKLKVYFVSADVRAQSAEVDEVSEALRELRPSGSASRLGQAVRTILNDLRGAPPAAILFVTDGINTEGESTAEAAEYARRKGVPLYAVGVGSTRPVRDLAISDLLMDDIVFVDDIVQVEFSLAGPGFAGKQVHVSLREGDKPRALAEMDVTIESDRGTQKVRLAHRPTEVGDFEYTVVVDESEDEANANNNRLERQVSVRKEAIRVLLVNSYPSFEFRYLKHMFERQGEKSVQLSTLLQESDLEYAEQDATALRVFPVRRDELFEFDVVIFGDVNPTFLSPSALENLAAFVSEKGGGMVFMAGPLYTPYAYRDTPLATLLPVEQQGEAEAPPLNGDFRQPFQLRPTELGMTSAAMYLGNSVAESMSIWRDLPPLYWNVEPRRLKPAARILAEHPIRMGADGRPMPLVVMQYVGAGKVVYHATDETWRWRFRTGDTYFARYWMQTIRYLSRSQLLGHDRGARLTAEVGRGSVRLRARFIDERLAPSDDDGVTLVVEHEGDKTQRISLRREGTSPGVFEATLVEPVEGRYHAWLATPTLEGKPPTVDFDVIPPPGEMQRLEMDVADLERAAKETNGRYLSFAEADDVLDLLPRGRLVPMAALPPISLWNTWPVLLALVAALVTEWVIRKRVGML